MISYELEASATGLDVELVINIEPDAFGARLAHETSTDQASVLLAFATELGEALSAVDRGRQIGYLARDLQHGPQRARLPELLRLLDDLQAMLGPPAGLG